MSLLSKLPGVAGVWEPLHDSKGVVPRRWGVRPHRNAMTDQDKLLLKQQYLLKHLPKRFSFWLLLVLMQNNLYKHYRRSQSLHKLVCLTWQLQQI